MTFKSSSNFYVSKGFLDVCVIFIVVVSIRRQKFNLVLIFACYCPNSSTIMEQDFSRTFVFVHLAVTISYQFLMSNFF